MRKLGWLGVLVAIMGLAMYAGTPVSGQQQQMPRPYGTPPPLVITAFGGKPVTYKAPRTPWGDPDLQGVWSSDDMRTCRHGPRGGGAGGGGRGARRRGAAPAPAAPGCSRARRSSAAVSGRRGPQGSAGSGRGRGQEKRRHEVGRLVPLRLRTARLPADAPARRSAGRPHADGHGPTWRTAACRAAPTAPVRSTPGRTSRSTSAASPAASAARSCASSTATATASCRRPASWRSRYEMLSDTRIFYTDGRPHVNQKIGHVSRRLARALGG